MKLKDRVAIVTGAAQGIGAAIVREFVREGAVVNAIDIKPQIRDVCARVGARPFCFDVTDFNAYEGCVNEIVRDNQGIDILAKGAIVSFTRSLAVELAPPSILAKAIAPGCIQTPLSIIDGVDKTTTEVFKTWYVAGASRC